MILSTAESARDARLRRLAHKHGLAVEKSRSRTWSIDDHGGYRIVDPYCNWVVHGYRFELDLDDVEAWLNQPTND